MLEVTGESECVGWCQVDKIGFKGEYGQEREKQDKREQQAIETRSENKTNATTRITRQEDIKRPTRKKVVSTLCLLLVHMHRNQHRSTALT